MADPDLKNFAPAASVQEWLQKVLDRSINAAPGQGLASDEEAPVQIEGTTPIKRAASLLKSSNGKENLFVRRLNCVVSLPA